MPRFPDYSSRTTRVGGSVFERFKPKMTAMGDSLVKMHIGDTRFPPVYDKINKMLVHQLYSAATVSQQMMLEPLQRRLKWRQRVCSEFQAYRDIVIKNLAVDFPVPEGTYFVLFSAEPFLRGRDYWQIIESCLDAGISIAPGDSFGKDFHSYIRLCFTAETPERLVSGIQRLNRILL